MSLSTLVYRITGLKALFIGYLMEHTSYYLLNRDKILARAHTFIDCACGMKVKYGSKKAHQIHSPVHRIYEQMMKSIRK